MAARTRPFVLPLALAFGGVYFLSLFFDISLITSFLFDSAERSKLYSFLVTDPGYHLLQVTQDLDTENNYLKVHRSNIPKGVSNRHTSQSLQAGGVIPHISEALMCEIPNL